MTTGSDPQPSSIGGQLSSESLTVEAFTRRWYEKLIEFIEAHGVRFDRTANENGQVVHPGGAGIVPISRVRAALRFIGEWDDRKRWVDVGIYVKAALGEAGYDPWAEWSAQSHKFNDAEAR